MAVDIKIHHKPARVTLRRVPAVIRAAAADPHIVEHIKSPLRVMPPGVKLCRPAEHVLELLPAKVRDAAVVNA